MSTRPYHQTESTQYAPQTGAYVVKVKSGQSTANWRDFDTVHIQVSVGQPYHEGEKLRATLEWAAARFKCVRIWVNDTLQRHTMMYEHGYDADEARTAARQAGQEWLERNAALLAAVPQLEILRWDSMLNDTDFRYMHFLTAQFYKNNAEFRESLDASILNIWSRRYGTVTVAGQAESEDEAFHRFAGFSRAYLLEEIAVFSMVSHREKAIDVYPGSLCREMAIFYGREVDGIPPGLNKRAFCRIDFSRSKMAETENAAPAVSPHLHIVRD